MVSGGMTDCCEEHRMIYCPHVSIECSFEWDAAKDKNEKLYNHLNSKDLLYIYI